MGPAAPHSLPTRAASIQPRRKARGRQGRQLERGLILGDGPALGQSVELPHDDAKEAFRAFVEKRPPRFGSSDDST